MKVTAKQANVLHNLNRIVIRKVGGRREPFLDGHPCRLQLNSLGAKGLIVFDALGRPARTDTRVEVLIGYERRGENRARARPRTSAAAEAEAESPSNP